LSFSPLFSIGGHSKNFLNLIKHISPEITKHNCSAYIITYNNNSKEKADNLNIIAKTNFLKPYRIKILKRFFPSGKAIFQAAELMLNRLKTTLIILKYKPDVIYCYAEKPLYLTFPLKKFFKFRLIYDNRGDIIDEHKVQGTSKRYISILSKLHTKALNSVDLVFSVSDSYNITQESKFVPKYNYYDGETFRFDESSMIQKKKELKLEDKFIFVYTGNMHYYQFLEGTVKFYSQFLARHEDAFFIIITEHDSTKFRSLLEKYNIPEANYLIKSLPQNEISNLQQIADVGFLLREDLPLNHHSFPTKFAEYLASGVPVLTTPYIYSVAPMVRESELGEVFEIKNDYSSEIDKIYSKYKSNLPVKFHCSNFAQSELMWQNKAKDIFDIINDI
jgi:glycosyltransferase involved in cell wall biosynthesis